MEYNGYPQKIPTASGAAMTAIIDATHAAAFRTLWGMSLLERNLRLAERLGAVRIHLLSSPQDEERASVRRFPGICTAQVHTLEGDALSLVGQLVDRACGPVLLLEAQVVYDRRLIGALWSLSVPAIIAGDQVEAVPLLVDASSRALLKGESWGARAARFLAQDGISTLAPEDVERHIAASRKTVVPRIIRVEDEAAQERADRYLKDLAGKGVNDLMAEFVHPPIEFFLTRLAARTRITPNQVSYFNALLNIAAVPLIFFGWLWMGIACNLMRGVTDGVDGKLARLTLRESKGGDRIDHVIDRLYLPAFFVALGWHLGGGDWLSSPMLAMYLLQVFYWTNRLLAAWFANFVGASSGDFRPLDRLVRRIWPKRNICVLLLLISMLFNAPLYGLWAMAGLSGSMVLYRSARLDWEARRLQRERSQAAERGGFKTASKPGCRL